VTRAAKIQRRKTIEDLRYSVTPTISATSVWKILAENGLYRRKARKVVFLTKAQKMKRKQWAISHRGWKPEDWERVIWSDESYIYIGDNKGTVWVTQSADEEYAENCVIPTFKQSSLRIMVWGCIMKGSKGPLVVLEYPGGKGGGMNAERYQEQVLDGIFFDYWMQMSEERGQILFQQDGAPSHTAKSTQEWLKWNSIDTLPHPPSSPDLNPIEPLWNKMKTLIHNRPHIPSSIGELKAAAFEAWDQITEADIDGYVNHMGDRVEAVLKAKGGHTMY